MAEDITDVYISTEAGDAGWQSLSALAAAQVEAELPISSEDGTVTLDSPSANTFNISTGGEEQVIVDANGHVAINPGDSASSLPRTNTMLEVVSDENSPFILILDGQKAAGIYDGRSGIRQYGTSTIYEYCIDETNGTYMFSGGPSSRSSIINGDTTADILVKPNEYVRLTPEVRTDKITSKVGAASDAAIELSANATISTGGSQSVIVTSDGRVGFGATPGSNVKFQNTGSAATGMRSDITHNSSSRYANSDGQLMVTNAAATADIAVMSGFRVVGRSNAGATVDQYYGCWVSEVPTGAEVAAGFRTTINGDGENEGQSGVNGFFNVYSDGSAPNYFGGEVRITPTRNLNCSKIVGATAPATDAAITLGPELLTSNHTPTQPNSISTKAYADTKAGLWTGTQAEYDALGIYNNQTLYCITD
ncbi:MAG: phage upper tail fiber protein [Pirellulales bacterium]